jgi:RNA polymerase sigma-54 factor
VIQADAEILQQGEQLQIRLLQPASEAIELRSTASASAAQRQAAKQLLQALQLREQNLYNIISAAAEQQIDMLMSQDQTRAKPLSQADLAAQLGLHPSTVSRAVRTRHVLWRGQPLPLRSLFSHGLVTADGDSVASMAIKATLRQIVAAEPANKPYSDAKLQQMLARQGYSIARRTVAKYRQLLGLPASHQRRRP